MCTSFTANERAAVLIRTDSDFFFIGVVPPAINITHVKQTSSGIRLLATGEGGEQKRKSDAAQCNILHRVFRWVVEAIQLPNALPAAGIVALMAKAWACEVASFRARLFLGGRLHDGER